MNHTSPLVSVASLFVFAVNSLSNGEGIAQIPAVQDFTFRGLGRGLDGTRAGTARFFAMSTIVTSGAAKSKKNPPLVDIFRPPIHNLGVSSPPFKHSRAVSMEYAVITSGGRFDFSLGKLAVTKSSIAAVDANGAMYAKQGEELVAVMRTDFAQEYEASLAELARLRSQKGRN